MVFRNFNFPRCPDTCRDLADYFEAQARDLRHHARGLESAELHDWRRTFKVWRSGKMARALAENGMPESLAVTTTARRLDVEPVTVTAQLKFQKDKAVKRQRDRQERGARRLAKQGHTLREIGRRLGLSKSRIQQILGTDPRNNKGPRDV